MRGSAAEATHDALVAFVGETKGKQTLIDGLNVARYEDPSGCRASFAVGVYEFTLRVSAADRADRVSTADCRGYVDVAIRRARLAR